MSQPGDFLYPLFVETQRKFGERFSHAHSNVHKPPKVAENPRLQMYW